MVATGTADQQGAMETMQLLAEGERWKRAGPDEGREGEGQECGGESQSPECQHHDKLSDVMERKKKNTHTKKTSLKIRFKSTPIQIQS